jgi:hypothetical protein
MVFAVTILLLLHIHILLLYHRCYIIWTTGSVIKVNTCFSILVYFLRPISWSSGQSFWLLIMRSRVRFPVLPWGLFLEGEDPLGDHVLGSLVEFRFKAPPGTSYSYTPSTSSGQGNCASWASQPQKSVTLRPQLGGETTKSIRDMWWHLKKIFPGLTAVLGRSLLFVEVSRLTLRRLTTYIYVVPHR